MKSLEAIREDSQAATAAATQRNRQPFVPFDAEEIALWPPFPFPFLGDYVPKGWKRLKKQWFVDSSGLGHPGEPALTFERFRQVLQDRFKVHPRHGYGIAEAGQFQVYVAAYRPAG